MKFRLKQNGIVTFDVIHPMTNREIHAEIVKEINKIELSPIQRGVIANYLISLENDNMFIDPCREKMTLSFGFTGDERHAMDRYSVAMPSKILTRKEKYLCIAFGLFVLVGIPIFAMLIEKL